MRLARRTEAGQGRRRSTEALTGEATSGMPEIAARTKLLNEWRQWKEAAQRTIPEEYRLDGPDPYHYYMKFVLLVSSLAPERLHELALPKSEWDKFKLFLEHQTEAGGHITRLDLWLDQAVGARIIFPQHADELISFVRPYMQRIFALPSYFGGEGMERYLLDLHLADPDFPEFADKLIKYLPDVRRRLEGMLAYKKTNAVPIALLCSRLFVLSPEDRDKYGERVQQFLAEHHTDIDLDQRMADGRFGGYHLEEPWYSVVLHPEAKIKHGRLVFERDQPVQAAKHLPARPGV